MKSALFCFLGVGVSSALSPAVLAAAPASRPNLVFILSDDVGQGDCWGEGGGGQKTTQEAGGYERGSTWSSARRPRTIPIPTIRSRRSVTRSTPMARSPTDA